MEDREIFRKDVEVLVGMIIEKENTEAGELYILARQLKKILAMALICLTTHQES